MSNLATIKAELQKLLDTANEKTGKDDADLTNAVGSLVEGYGGDVEIIMAEDVAFSSEHNDSDTALYAIGYNWYADLVGRVQDLAGVSRKLSTEEIIYWLGKLEPLDTAWAISENNFVLNNDNYCTGYVITIPKGNANSNSYILFNTVSTAKGE